MATVELTTEEARAIADVIWGNPVDTRWLCSANNKITAALDSQTAEAAVQWVNEFNKRTSTKSSDTASLDAVYGERLYK